MKQIVEDTNLHHSSHIHTSRRLTKRRPMNLMSQAMMRRKPKKKSFMDDDDDDIPALRNPQQKSKSDKDRENDEMFRKAAEEDGKCKNDLIRNFL